MEAVGTLAAGLAHDMNNALAAITSFASVLIEDAPSARFRSDLAQIVTQAERGAGLTRGLLAFSRRGQYRKSVVALDRIVGDVIPLLARTLPSSIEIQQTLAPGLHIDADPTQLEQIMVNLCVNAAEAMTGTGTLVITVDSVTLETSAAASLGVAPGRYARIRVVDTGSGMDEATRRRVFEPFFTTKPHGKGTGLGLSTVWGIVQTHHGAVGVESAPDRGATFTVHLPISEAALAGPRKQRAPSPMRASRILVVDDEPAVRDGTRRLLERMGHEVFVACDGSDALRVFDEHGDALQLVVLDMKMPVMDGATCFAKLRERSDVAILIATGYALDAEVQALVAVGAGIIEKPFRSADFTAEVARLLSRACSVELPVPRAS
jgi:CheY-like chemotaxis protein